MVYKQKRIVSKSDLEKVMGEPGWKEAPPGEVKELEAAIRAAAIKRRGGARPGAGRKPSGRVPATMKILPETRAYLTKMAGGNRGIGAIVDRLVKKTHLKKIDFAGK